MIGVNELDQLWFLWIQANLRCESLDPYFTLFRDKHTWIPFYVFLLSWLFFQYGIKAWKVIIVCIVMIAVSDQVNSSLIKKMVKRERPCRVENLLKHYQPLISCSGGYSFPSSHATNHMGLAVLLILLIQKGKTRFWLLAWALMVGFSQVYVGVHYTFDVMVGFLEGAMLAIMVYRVFNKFTGWSKVQDQYQKLKSGIR